MTGAICVAHRQTGLTHGLVTLFGMQRPPKTAILTAEGTTIAKQRDELANTAFRHGAEWVLFVDDDHLVPTDGLMRLLAHDVPVVGGIYVTRTPPYMLTAFRTRQDHGVTKFRSIGPEDIASHGLVDVDACGMGFTLIRRAAFEAVEAPRFRLGQFHPSEMGEDTYFTSRVREAGLRVAVDAGLRIPHLAVKAVLPGREGQTVITEIGEAMAETRGTHGGA